MCVSKDICSVDQALCLTIQQTHSHANKEIFLQLLQMHKQLIAPNALVDHLPLPLGNTGNLHFLEKYS